MSSHFIVRCEVCEVDGPQIRRGAGGTRLIASAESTDIGWLPVKESAAVWAEFLIEHEYHELRLVHE